ncbi:hypothetical protein Acr_05g0011390 [Actinidia rufa]|uniref:Uncharacterized protein n=1 Tax=Actinidia rufa TaxID=165716 RepID=A0A7J0EM83_9ERIC|nr:hypothetical protein Acr_05g0011390 [Actinidia rufa]
MSCIQVTAYHPSVNLGTPSVRFRSICHSGCTPCMLCVAPTHINRFPRISLKIASSISAYRQRAPVCLFGGKGKSENTDDIPTCVEDGRGGSLAKEFRAVITVSTSEFFLTLVPTEIISLYWTPNCYQATPWKTFEKAMRSSKKEPPAEELLKQQMAKEEYYDDGDSGYDDGGSSRGNRRGGGNGDFSGQSGDDGSSWISDDISQATFATIGLVCVYIYILHGEEITQVAKELVMGKLGSFLRRRREAEEEEEEEEVEPLMDRGIQTARLGIKPKRIKSPKVEDEDREELKGMSSSELVLKLELESESESESDVEVGDTEELELRSFSEVEEEELERRSFPEVEDEEELERKSFQEMEDKEELEPILRSSRKGEEEDEELSLIRAFLDMPRFKDIPKMYPIILEYLSKTDDEEEIEGFLRSLPDEEDEEEIERVLRSFPEVENKDFEPNQEKEVGIFRSFPKVEDEEFEPMLRSLSEWVDEASEPNQEEEEEDMKEERILRSFLKVQDAEFDRVLRSFPAMEDEEFKPYQEEEEEEEAAVNEHAEEYEIILRSYQEEEERILRSFQELEEEKGPLSEEEEEEENDNEEDERLHRSY